MAWPSVVAVPHPLGRPGVLSSSAGEKVWPCAVAVPHPHGGPRVSGGSGRGAGPHVVAVPHPCGRPSVCGRNGLPRLHIACFTCPAMLVPVRWM